MSETVAATNGQQYRFNAILYKDAVKSAATGRCLEILERVAGIPAEVLDGRHHPCPWCGGEDRFSLIDADAGAVLCRNCFKEKNGDWLAAVQKGSGCSFQEAIAKGAEFLGMELSISPATDRRLSDSDVLHRSVAESAYPWSRLKPTALKC
jgi:phage/plasmid primase-like uncharacterized protein